MKCLILDEAGTFVVTNYVTGERIATYAKLSEAVKKVVELARGERA